MITDGQLFNKEHHRTESKTQPYSIQRRSSATNATNQYMCNAQEKIDNEPDQYFSACVETLTVSTEGGTTNSYETINITLMVMPSTLYNNTIHIIIKHITV